MHFFQKRTASSVFLFALLLLLFTAPAGAQVIFEENFEDGIDSSFKLLNLDGRTPDPEVDFVNDAWVAGPDNVDNTDTVAYSTSWYAPAGAANDWMITPKIHIDSGTILSWQAMSPDASFRDGYEVRISTTDTAVASFLTNFTLFNTNAEQTTWTTRIVDLTNAGYMNQDVYFAFINNSNDKYILKIDDIIVRNPSAVDAKAISLQVPSSTCQLGAAESISVTVENYGATSLTNFNITYVIDTGGTPLTVTEAVTIPALALGSRYTYTFTQPADLSAPGVLYNISAYVSATSDADLTNDSLVAIQVLNVQPADLSTGYSTSFETVGQILGWSVADSNADGVTWFPAQGTARTGDISFIYQYNQDAITAANDWLFSTCLDATAGVYYKLNFFYRVGNSQGTIYPEKLKVAIGTSANIASMTTVLENLGEVNNDVYQEHSITFTVPASGVYYIGFHCYSDADAFFLAIDDVTVEELQAPTASFTTGTDELEVTFSSTSQDADSLYWDFGDGDNSTTNPIVHTYDTAGTYYVCLTAVNVIGSNTFCDSVTVAVGGNAPVALFTSTKNELVVNFTSTSTDADNILWDFGDSTTATTSPVTHTYAAPGTYYVCLAAYNSFGNDTYCDSVSVDTTVTIGIALIDESEFSVFPNPTQGTLMVQLNEKVIGESMLVVSDLVGKKLLEMPVTNTRMSFDFSEKPEGVYLITLQVGDSQLRRKVVLAR